MSSRNRRLALALAATLLASSVAAEPAMALLPAGSLTPFMPRDKSGGAIAIDAFRLDRLPVSGDQFAAFLRRQPQWRRSQIKAVFADRHYLEHWRGDLQPPKGAGRRPVTNVSWFAAQAYCAERGASLPTTDQWEYALEEGGRDEDARREAILAWYGHPNRRPPVLAALKANGYGVRGLIGAVWELTEDFNSAGSSAELRESGLKNKDLFCGGASVSAKDAADYAAFMRFSMRVSLKASYATDDLGFRCAREATS